MLRNTNQFLWHPKATMFSAEASTVFHDGVPREFDMESERTGRKVTVSYTRVERDREGDVQAWVYKPKGGNLHFLVTVFND